MNEPLGPETSTPPGRVPGPLRDGVAPPAAPPSYPTNNGTAVMALVSTLLPLPILGGVLGIVLGVCARREIERHGQTGEAMAVVAIVLGALELVPVVVFALLMLITAGSLLQSTPRTGQTGTGQPVGSATAAPPTAAAPAPATAAPATAQPTASPGVSSGDAVGTVGRYFAAINTHDYPAAYATFGSGWQANHPYGQFASGFSDTVSDQTRQLSADQAASATGTRDVHTDFVSLHADGSTVPYTCTYTVGLESSKAVIQNGTCRQT